MDRQEYQIGQVLGNLNIKQLNEMQTASLVAIKENTNTILLSPTGTGKTLAYLLPIYQQLDPTNKYTQVLIIVPSRELAQQIELVFKSMATGHKITACYGGHKRETEENNLIEPPAIIVGTPGRLSDHIRRGSITVASIGTVILDEFDKLVELGFEEEMAFVIGSLPNLQKKVLTSATKPEVLPTFLQMEGAAELNYLPDVPLAQEKLAIKTVLSNGKDKADTLFQLLCALGSNPTIIFCNHRESVERLGEIITAKGITSTFYHGGMEQQQRDAALAKFRNGTVDYLITTDLAARGLDIPHIRYIIHYHLPLNEESFTHRNGRTARMDSTGTGILILSPGETLPTYITDIAEEITLPETTELPDAPKWTTLFIAAGKKDKVNKVDIVGFLAQKGHLKKEDIGLIEVKDFFSFVAIRKSKTTTTLQAIKNEKIKNQKVMIAVAK